MAVSILQKIFGGKPEHMKRRIKESFKQALFRAVPAEGVDERVEFEMFLENARSFSVSRSMLDKISPIKKVSTCCVHGNLALLVLKRSNEWGFVRRSTLEKAIASKGGTLRTAPVPVQDFPKEEPSPIADPHKNAASFFNI